MGLISDKIGLTAELALLANQYLYVDSHVWANLAIYVHSKKYTFLTMVKTCDLNTPNHIMNDFWPVRIIKT